MAIQQIDNIRQNPDVFQNLFPNSWPLDLHCDNLPVSESGPVDLPQRRGAHWLGIKTRKRLGYSDTQVGPQDCFNFLERERLNFVLELAQSFYVYGRQDVRPRG